MRQAAAILVLALSTTLGAQESRPFCGDPGASGTTPGSAPPSSALARTGIRWSEGLGPVLHQGKPILLFQLLGNFSEGDC